MGIGVRAFIVSDDGVTRIPYAKLDASSGEMKTKHCQSMLVRESDWLLQLSGYKTVDQLK